MKVITITLNPAIDKTILCESFRVGATNIVQSVVEDVAGKGINVSKNLRMLGQESEILGIFAGVSGQRCIDWLKNEQFNVHHFWGEGETRLNQKIVDSLGETTELNEKGPTVPPKILADIKKWIFQKVDSESIVVVSGSLPQGVPVDYYQELVRLIHEKSGRCILDVSGPSLSEALEALPDCIKPNLDECQQILKINHKPSLKEMVHGFMPWIEKGIRLIVVSLGKHGALFITKCGSYYCKGLNVQPHSTVGAGDAMVSSITYSLIHHEGLDLLIRRAIAVSAAATETKGTKPAPYKRIQELMETIESIEEVL